LSPAGGAHSFTHCIRLLPLRSGTYSPECVSIRFPVFAGGAHAALGLVNNPPAGTVSISGASADLHLNRAVPSLEQSAADSQLAAVLRAHVDYTNVASQCCPGTAWPLVTVLQQLQIEQQQQLHQQLLQQQGSSGVLLDSHVAAAPEGSSQLWQRRRTSEDPSTATTAAATTPSVESIYPEGMTASGQPNQAPDADRQAAAPAPAAAQEALPAGGSAPEAPMSIQWELCIQASSGSQLKVVTDSGAVVLSCGTEMVTMRAASGDGSSMRARSAADVVAQLSVQVCHDLARFGYTDVQRLHARC